MNTMRAESGGLLASQAIRQSVTVPLLERCPHGAAADGGSVSVTTDASSYAHGDPITVTIINGTATPIAPMGGIVCQGSLWPFGLQRLGPGHVLDGQGAIGPLQPVERVGVPPPTPSPAVCTARGLVVYNAATGAEGARLRQHEPPRRVRTKAVGYLTNQVPKHRATGTHRPKENVPA